MKLYWCREREREFFLYCPSIFLVFPSFFLPIPIKRAHTHVVDFFPLFPNTQCIKKLDNKRKANVQIVLRSTKNTVIFIVIKISWRMILSSFFVSFLFFSVQFQFRPFANHHAIMPRF